MNVPSAAVNDAKYIVAAPCWVAGDIAGAGAGAGDPTSGNTVIASFMFPVAQWVALVHKYHFFPALARVIISFPVVRATLVAAGVQFWNETKSALWTLWSPGEYLKTAQNWKLKFEEGKHMVFYFEMASVTKLPMQQVYCHDISQNNLTN